LGQKTLQLGPSLPPVTAAATTCRTGRNRQSYFGGEEWEVVNSLVFVATGSRRHRRRPQLPLLLVRATAAAAAAWGRGVGHLVLARVGSEWCGRSVFGPRLQILGLTLSISAQISSLAALNCLRLSGNSALTAAISASDCIALNCVSLSCGAAQTI